MLEIKTIDKLPIGARHRCFIEIMSHHAPASSFPPEAMMRMNTMRGVDYRASLCAMEGDRMVAFILNSVGIWDRKQTAYDISTGIVAEYRPTPLSRELLIRVKEHLKKFGFRQYMLDVAAENEKSRSLYRNLGFEETRRFVTMRLYGRPLSVVRQSTQIDEAKREEWSELRTMMINDNALKPCWLNAWETFYHMPDAYTVYVARIVGEVAGVVIFSQPTGEIHQLWVNSQWRASGVASALLAKVAENSQAGGSLIWNNIDMRATDLLNFLRGRGFEDGVSKTEMAMELFQRQQ